jgi:hypothetical protein
MKKWQIKMVQIANLELSEETKGLNSRSTKRLKKSAKNLDDAMEKEKNKDGKDDNEDDDEKRPETSENL